MERTKHIAMWEWLAENPGWYEDAYFQSNEIRNPVIPCYMTRIPDQKCQECPFKRDTELCFDGLYDRWRNLCGTCIALYEYDNFVYEEIQDILETEISDLCRRIAHWPLREGVPQD